MDAESARGRPADAGLVQLCTGFVYRGPVVIQEMSNDLQ